MDPVYTPQSRVLPTPEQSSFTFSKRFRLRKRGQFLSTQRRGLRLSTQSLLIYVCENHSRPVRIGITVSKKVGRAHQRNRIKRLIREAYRMSDLRQMKGLDLVLIAKKESPPTILRDLQLEFHQILQLINQRLLSKSFSARSMHKSSSKKRGQRRLKDRSKTKER